MPLYSTFAAKTAVLRARSHRRSAGKKFHSGLCFTAQPGGTDTRSGPAGPSATCPTSGLCIRRLSTRLAGRAHDSSLVLNSLGNSAGARRRPYPPYLPREGLAGHQRRARWAAPGAVLNLRKSHSPFREAVPGRGCDLRARITHVGDAQVIRKDHHDVWTLWRRTSRHRRSKHGEEGASPQEIDLIRAPPKVQPGVVRRSPLQRASASVQPCELLHHGLEECG